MKNKKSKELLDKTQLKVIEEISKLDKSSEDTKMFLFKIDGYLESLKDRKNIKNA